MKRVSCLNRDFVQIPREARPLHGYHVQTANDGNTGEVDQNCFAGRCKSRRNTPPVLIIRIITDTVALPLIDAQLLNAYDKEGRSHHLLNAG